MDLETELALVEEAKVGLTAFQKLYEHYYPKIFLFCMQRTLNKEHAEDIVGETFLAAVKQLKTFDTSKGVRFGAWLYRVANNKIIDGRRRTTPSDFGDAILLLEDEEQESPEDFAARMELQRQIADVLPEIKPRYQEILSLRYYSELDNGEIAALLDMKVTQVNVLLHRALKSFREKFLKKYPQTEIFNLL